MTDELTGRDLDERLAKAMGWECDLRNPKTNRPYREPKWRNRPEWFWAKPLSEYHASIDALLRDVWPECQRRGFTFWGVDGPTEDGYYEAETSNSERHYFGHAETPALALARAMLSALEAPSD